MHISWLWSLPLLTVVSALAIQKRDADFLSVRTKQHKDMSGKGGDPKNKYFHESVFHPHYDGRFADKQLGYRERRLALSNLIQTYLATFADIGVETWLMHGTLLGWWWNRKILPWDSDSDVQVSEASIHYLASYYNMSVFHYKTPRIPEGRDYMLEINPHYVDRSQADKMNVIDARWVDTTSGLFIDITTARYNYTHPAGPGMLSCKDGHEYRDSYIFPLRDTFFEGAPAKIPFAYKELLEAEYKQRALTLTEFEGHRFDDQKLEWIPIPKKLDAPKKEAKKPEPKKEESKKEEMKADEKKVEAPKQPQQGQQGQQAQNQQPEQSNQQSQQTDPQKPPPSNSDTKPQGGQPQGQQSPPPPVAKQGTQPMSSEPQKPAIQQKAEDKKAESEAKQSARLEKVEAHWKAKELKAAMKAEDRKKEEERGAKKAAAEEAKKDDTSKQANSPSKPEDAEQKKNGEAEAVEKKKSQKSEIKAKRSLKEF